MGEMSKNLILIGMPDSGKTTIGELLSKKLGLKFVDTNQYIENNCGKSIPELLNNGQDNFKIIETEVVHKLSRLKHSVISTEVEVLKNDSNVKELRENGIIIFIDKPSENQELTDDTSPLKEKVLKFHEHLSENYAIYRKCCDLHLVNDNNIDDIVYYISSIYS
jgi:Shikimate kinase